MFKNLMVGMALLCLMSLAWAKDNNALASINAIKAKVIAAEKAPLIARKKFSEAPLLQNVILSPDGKHLAYKLHKPHWQELWHYDLATDTHRRLLSTKQAQALHWSADAQYLIYEHQRAVFRVGIKPGNLAQKLFTLNGEDADFIGPDKDVPGHYWVKQFAHDKQQHQLRKYHNAGTYQIALQSQYPITGFLSQQGQIQVVKLLINEQHQVSLVDKTTLQTLTHCRALSACQLHSWDPENKVLLLSTYFHQNTLSLFSVNAVTGQKSLLHQHPDKRFDLLDVSVDSSGKPQFVSYQTDYSAHYALNDAVQPILQKIQDKTASPQLYIGASRAHDIFQVNDANPASSVNKYWIFDATQMKCLQPFSHLQQHTIPERWVAPRVAFWYKASDGMLLQGYLTLPLGKDPADVPLIAMPHGGPWNRSQGAYSRQAQFLANRGYAVFEPNFRSSTGLGLNYLLSANRDFGHGRVQQDILDGLDHLLERGIGDGEQQAIVGHSFGGFSTLTALSFTPERFRVGFAGAAPANLAHTLVRYSKKIPRAQRAGFDLRIKTLLLDSENQLNARQLYQQSPNKHLDKITSPLYLWAGERDARVAIEDIRDIALRLSEKQLQVVLLSDPTEGHSPETDLAKEAYLYLMESALAQHLNGRKEKVTSPPLSSYLKKYLVLDTIGLISTSSKI